MSPKTPKTSSKKKDSSNGKFVRKVIVTNESVIIENMVMAKPSHKKYIIFRYKDNADYHSEWGEGCFFDSKMNRISVTKATGLMDEKYKVYLVQK